MTDDAVSEIRALRERLARLEALTTQQPGGEPVTRANLTEAIADHYSKPLDKRRQLERDADGFSPDMTMESALRARARDPEAYDAAMRGMAAPGLPLALYTKRRAAAIALGRFDPEGDTE